MNYDQAKIKAEILKALAHPIRILLVDALSVSDKSVTELNELVAVDQSTISRHLSQLKRVGIVSERREGARVIHHLETPCILSAISCAETVLKECHCSQSRLLGSLDPTDSAKMPGGMHA